MGDATLAERLVQGEVQPAVYRLVGRVNTRQLASELARCDWRLLVINGKMVVDKGSFLEAAGLGFPAWAGRNWDAFEELLNDLSWAPAQGYALLMDPVYRFASAQPDEWRTALAILQSAIESWERQGVPMVVLLAKNWWWNRQLPKLTVYAR